MDSEEFRRRGKEMVDYIADYYDNIRDRKVAHDVRPGYMRDLVPAAPPVDGEDWQDIMADVERVVMPGVTHWRSPRFHGYYAAGGSYPSLMGDMLCDAIGCIGFSWAASPACTELEMITTDWLGEMMGLPDVFLHSKPGPGGGVIQATASETVFLCVLAARTRKVISLQNDNPSLTSADIIPRLVCYSSDQANSSVHRSGLLAEVKMRKLESDDNFCLRGETLRQAMEEDKANGLIPFFLCATLGTTGACSFDNIAELGPLCQQEGVWLHIDAAYAGSAFVCPEFRHHLKGVEYADTFSMNPHKWMLVNFDLSVMWIQDRGHLVDAFNVDPIYLKHNDADKIPDYRHWQIPLGRRFRSLKLWFVIRSYGVSGIQKYIREHCERARQFEQMLLGDGRFEIPVPVVMGLVCFRLKGANRLTEKLHDAIISGGSIYLIPAYARCLGQDVYFLRLAIVAETVTEEDLGFSFNVISQCATQVLSESTDSDTTDSQYKPMINIDALPSSDPGKSEEPTPNENIAGDITRKLNGVTIRNDDVTSVSDEDFPVLKSRASDVTKVIRSTQDSVTSNKR